VGAAAYQALLGRLVPADPFRQGAVKGFDAGFPARQASLKKFFDMMSKSGPSVASSGANPP
jgi:hypothetical protein